VGPDLEGKLPEGFQERQSFDVTRGAPDLGDQDIALAFLSGLPDALFNLVGDVRE
jgi:hypothetical protein